LPPSDGLDADGLRSYRLALAREARQHKRYPPQAIDAGWEGTAEIQVTLRAGGVAEGVRLTRSSGHAVLDEAALSMLGRALPATPVPPALRERTFAVNLPVVFELPR
jgi:periplasmic protein TonB